MRFLVFSDVHGNLPALEFLLKYVQDIDGYIFLGDAVNYGPWNNECLQLICDLPNSKLIKGNHDEYFENGVCNVQNELVQEFFKHTYEKFTQHKLLAQLNYEGRISNYNLCHTLYNKYIFEDTAVEIDNNYMIGHSHHQFQRKIDDHILINAGSVGQNRKYINIISFAIFDTQLDQIMLKNISYDFDYFIKELRVRNYSEKCINYYLSKTRL